MNNKNGFLLEDNKGEFYAWLLSKPNDKDLYTILHEDGCKQELSLYVVMNWWSTATKEAEEIDRIAERIFKAHNMKYPEDAEL